MSTPKLLLYSCMHPGDLLRCWTGGALLYSIGPSIVTKYPCVVCAQSDSSMLFYRSVAYASSYEVRPDRLVMELLSCTGEWQVHIWGQSHHMLVSYPPQYKWVWIEWIEVECTAVSLRSCWDVLAWLCNTSCLKLCLSKSLLTFKFTYGTCTSKTMMSMPLSYYHLLGIRIHCNDSRIVGPHPTSQATLYHWGTSAL